MRLRERPDANVRLLARAHYRLARELETASRTADAIQEFRRALDLLEAAAAAPVGRAYVCARLGWLLIETGEHKGTRELFWPLYWNAVAVSGVWTTPRLQQAEKSLRRALSPGSRPRGDVDRASVTLADVLTGLNRVAESRALVESGTPEDPYFLEFRSDLDREQGNLAAAESHALRSLELVKRWSSAPVDRAGLQMTLSWALLDAHKLAESESVAREAIATLRTAGPAWQHRLSGTLTVLARTLVETGQIEEARGVAAEARTLRADAPDLLPRSSYAITEAMILEAQGRLQEAEADFRTAIAGRRKALGDGHYLVATARQLLASLPLKAGHHKDALAELKTALKIREAVFSAHAPVTVRTRALVTKATSR